MERVFSTRASGLDAICLGSVMASGAGRVWEVAGTVIIIAVGMATSTTITKGDRVRMDPRSLEVRDGLESKDRPVVARSIRASRSVLAGVESGGDGFPE